MPGMGFSDKPEKHTYSFEEMADVYSTLLQELRITALHILSHDLGNSVVQELIARNEEGKNPFRIKSIAFLNGGLFSDVYRPRLIQVLLSKSPKPIGRLLSNLMTRNMVAKASSEVFGKNTKPSKQLLDDFWDILNYNNGKSIAYLLGRLIFEKDKYQQRWISAMQDTSIPMCFINGPADPNSGIHMVKRYRDIIPNPQIHLLSENIGHWPQIEAPEEVLSAFYSFHTKLKAYYS
jgi:pimeloyl-ACP methyl ester carboxylesterase